MYKVSSSRNPGSHCIGEAVEERVLKRFLTLYLERLRLISNHELKVWAEAHVETVICKKRRKIAQGVACGRQIKIIFEPIGNISVSERLVLAIVFRDRSYCCQILLRHRVSECCPFQREAESVTEASESLRRCAECMAEHVCSMMLVIKRAAIIDPLHFKPL